MNAQANVAADVRDDAVPSSTWTDEVTAAIDRARYRLQQQGLAFSLGVGGRLWSLMLSPRQRRASKAAILTLMRRYEALLQRDLDNVARGYYPRELLFQFPLGEYLRRLPQALTEAPRLLWRSYRGRHDDLPLDVDPNDYPPYYLRTFHWQSGGWLTSRSARLYDASVEFLFGGTADIMRRMAIPPLVDAVGEHRRPRILDVGCGTARFLLQLGRAVPQAKLYGLDLSAAYVQHAADVLAPMPGVSLVADNAESMPFADGFFDAVSSIFLFHELPNAARRTVMHEVWRVLKPGSVFVVSDSAQLCESATLEEVLHGFARAYHEPYYKSYVRDDLDAIMSECGFTDIHTEPHLVSKVVVGRKPKPGRRRRRLSS